MTETTHPIYTPITNYEVPNLNNDQLSKFNMDTMHVHEVMRFDPEEALQILQSNEGEQVIGADFGGDKGVSQLFDIKDSGVVTNSQFREYKQGTGGEGYADVLRSTESYALNNNLPIGISWGTPVKGTKPMYHPKVDIFLTELESNYDGDFAKLAPHLTSVINDGPAGLISGAVEVFKKFGAKNVIFPINGGGLGMAVLKDGVLYATEAGHVEADPDLNPYNRTGECGVFEQKHVCLEMLGANKAGIEVIWEKLTGTPTSAREIEKLYLEGNDQAGNLYDSSALVVAHMIAGTAKAFGLDLFSPDVAIVGHGGGFKFPYYGERIMQILNDDKNVAVQLIMTKDFGDKESNACLDGAAINAIVANQLTNQEK